MCFIITLLFFCMQPTVMAAVGKKDVIIFCLPVHFIIHHDHLLTCGGNLIIDSLRMPADDHSSGHLFVDDGKAMTSCKTKKTIYHAQAQQPCTHIG